MNVIKEVASPKKKTANYVRNSSAIRSPEKGQKSSKLENALKIKLNNMVAKKVAKTEK